MTYMALKGMALSVAYMSTGLTYVLVIFSAKHVLGEVIDQRQKIAITLIICGVIVFNF